ncbi:MAG: hypothetical protein KDJ18_04515 [Hyphomicrobiaceae bacterium]|nr:hypothetical protein [Hyphomicrobiaceae bacterium]
MTTISKTLATAALACGLAISAATGASAAGTGALAGLKSAAPQSPIVDVKGRGARNVGIAILGAAAATAIIAGAARSERRRHHYDRHSDRCDFYDYKCSEGHGWACRKFDYHCGGDY